MVCAVQPTRPVVPEYYQRKTEPRWGALVLLGVALFGCAPEPDARRGTSARATEHLQPSAPPRISPDFPLAPLAYAPTAQTPLARGRNAAGEWLFVYELTLDDVPYQLVGMRVSAAGAVIDPRGIVLATVDAYRQNFPGAVVHTGDHWLVFHSDPSGGYATKLSNDGVVQGTTAIGGVFISALWGGDRALIVRNTTGQFVDGNAQPLGPPFTILSEAGAVAGSQSAVSTDGSVYLVPYDVNNGSAVRVAAVLPQGPMVTTATLSNVARGFQSSGGATALGPRSFDVSYIGPQPTCVLGGRCTPPVVYCRSVSVDAIGTILLGPQTQTCSGGPPQPVPPSVAIEAPLLQRAGAATFVADDYFVAWQDEGRGGIVGTHVSRDGVVAASAPIPIAATSRAPTHVASNGTSSLVTMGDGGALQAIALVSAAGSVSAVPFDISAISPDAPSTVAVSDGSDYLVGWGYPWDTNPPSPSSHAALVSAGGVFSTPVDFPEGDSDLSAAFAGGNYVIVWSETGAPDTLEVRAVRISRSLQVLDAPPRLLFQYPASAFVAPPIIAAGPNELLVVFREDVGSGQIVLRARRVTTDLSPIGAPIDVATNGPASTWFRAVWDGASYWVVWQSDLALLGRRIGSEGQLLDAVPFEIAPEFARTWISLDLRSAGDGSALVVYRRGGALADLRGRILRSSGGQGGMGGTQGQGGTSGQGTAGSGGSGGSASGDSGEGGQAGAADGGAAGQTATGGNGGSAGSGTGGSGVGDGGVAGEGDPGGTAGVAARGGSAGRGGSASDAGRGGSMTAGSSTGGRAGGDGAGQGGGAGSAPSDDSGCTCATAPRSAPASGLWLALAAASVGLARARRVRRSERGAADAVAR